MKKKRRFVTCEIVLKKEQKKIIFCDCLEFPRQPA